MPKDIPLAEPETALTKADLNIALNSLFQMFLQATENGVIVQQKIGGVVISTITVPLETYLQAFPEVKRIVEQKADIARAIMDVRNSKR